ncbi:hypothetical protein LBBP_03913 [Leptospira borgpetersenii serovar Ballum]|uniref:Uncharacterized protein n=1 Tax=Leptospira borgpetersenii serovar Ballum TaxID=280505 RepID=A0A0S2IWR6_LEPBO|nr:hypothetical protein LBBP_03913 [Leptospira borgpetersenii serovar Ballum]
MIQSRHPIKNCNPNFLLGIRAKKIRRLKYQFKFERFQ